MTGPVRTPSALKALAANCIWQGPAPSKANAKPSRVLYLTFDDGPMPGVTDVVLRLLRAHDAKATFFCLGRQVEKHPELTQQIVNEGHSIGNHTFRHSSGWGTSLADYRADIAAGDAAILQATGLTTSLFRPPYGRLPLSMLGDFCRSRPVVMWSLCTWDFDLMVSANDVVRNVRRHAKSGDIILLHDNAQTGDKLLSALPALLLFARENGYNLQALPQTLAPKS